MSWNGSGVFTRLFSWQSDAAAGIDITASRMDGDTNNITAVGFSNCLTRDGQGSATGLLPMNGFRHTGVSNGVAATDYATVGQIQAPGTPAGTALIPAGAYLGEIRTTALPEPALPGLMPGWHICGGGTRPRTDPLWVAFIGPFPGGWAFGSGDGSTTYTLPDLRGRAAIGKDDMGGSAANRVTAGVSGIAGTTLGGSGGDQHAQADTITTTLSGAVSASSTAVSTPAESPHTHTTATSNPLTVPLITAGGATNNAVNGAAGTTGASSTGITVATSVTTTTTNSLAAASTSALTGASQNVQPSLVVNYVIFTGA